MRTSAALVLLVSLPALAQTRSDVEVTRADIQADRKAIVAAALPLTEEQAAAFWPVYQEYRGELSKVGDRAIKLVTDYGAQYDTLTDPQAATLLGEFLAVQKEALKVKDKYVTHFTKAIPPKLVMRFYQIENKLDSIIQLDAVSAIPLAK